MKKISIYFTDVESLEVALENANWHGSRLIDDDAGDYGYLLPIISDNGNVSGWISVYTDEHDCANDLISEEASDYIDS